MSPESPSTPPYPDPRHWRYLALGIAALMLLPLASPLTAQTFPEPPSIQVREQTPIELYVQFAITNVLFPGRLKPTPIWTRAYGVEEGKSLIPGPSLHFFPGDFLQITLNNLLDTRDPNRGFNALLKDFETNVNPTYDTDEIAGHVHGEVNIPHNPNNTNLHVHGLHVDPSHDDVTLIIIPEGDSKLRYSPDLWPYIREQIWPYQYRVPPYHLPGTHWYHAHKHGSTSLHVENGMAGALIMQPNNPNDDIVPGLSSGDDRVMILQEIANYGVQRGIARGNAAPTDFDVDSAAVSAPGIVGVPAKDARRNKPLITVNGEVMPTLTLQPKQLERWRFINAAANHHSFTYLWLGKLVTTDKKGNSTYQEVPMHLAAIDGITLKQLVETTAEKPIFLGPGNRADVLIQIEEKGSYAVFKNFPSNIKVLDAQGKVVTPAAAQDKIANPYLLPQTTTANANFETFQVDWFYLNEDGSFQQPQQTVIAPNLRVTPGAPGKDGSVLLDLVYPTEFGKGAIGWQPIAAPDVGGGATDTQLLFNIKVEGPAVSSPLSLPDAAQLAKTSPTGMAHPPSYVSPIEVDDILQSRTAVFDLSGIDVLVVDRKSQEAEEEIRQFTLNGRQFNLDDSIGNPAAPRLVAKEPHIPPIAMGSPSEGGVDLVLTYVEAHGLWANQCWTNPGFYQPVVTVEDKDGNTGYQYQPYAGVCGGDPTLTYEDVTGLDQVSVINPAYPGYDQVAGIPGVPVSTTAEEWVLINNSPIGHPFHIHINPFFITEVGQLSYEPFEGDKECGGTGDNKAWVIRTINPDKNGKAADACQMAAPTGPATLTGTSTMWWVVNNWWDTIVIPPRGYVKFRYWMNVPQQNGDGSRVVDNVNRFGDWVYHCHILRHEDRGMMMVVGTQPKETKPGAPDTK